MEVAIMLSYINLLCTVSLSNKYFKWYSQICSRAYTRSRTKKEAKFLLGYVENHHILPKSYRMGGYNESDNIVQLTAREHLICHKLLVRFSSDVHLKRMLFAVKRMMTDKSHCSLRYEYYKQRLSVLCTGEGNHRFGKSHSEETCRKFSETRRGSGNPMFGKPSRFKGIKGRVIHTAETKAMLSKKAKGHKRNLGRKATNEQVKTMQEAQSKVKRKQCIHCGLETTPSNIKRHHNDNCKFVKPWDNGKTKVEKTPGAYKKCTDGVLIFKSITELAKFYGIKHATAMSWLKSKKHQNICFLI
jgi:hypothetical protein